MNNMKVCSIPYDNWGEEEDLQSDWSLCMAHATFKHREACEFIFWIGGDCTHEWPSHQEKYLQELGFSDTFMELIRQAKLAKYDYACFYS